MTTPEPTGVIASPIESKKKNSARKLTRDDWIAAARTMLVEGGVDDVKVDRLATVMGVTRGSFYWHFQHHQDLLDGLLSDWESRNFFEIAQVRTRWARTEPDLTEVVVIWLGEDPSFPAFDMAIRGWARKDSVVESSVSRVDTAWITLLQEVFLKCEFDATESLIRARVTYFHQIGYYAIGLKEDITDRIRLAPYYYQILTGQPAPRDLLKRMEELENARQSVKRRRARP